MSDIFRIHLGTPAVLEFRGPDAVRFLNGQLTQDVRRVAGSKISLPACVTDAKGKLQYRVTLFATDDDALLVSAPTECAEGLETRLTRYLIADDVETADLTGNYALVHFTGAVSEAPSGVIVRESNRFGIAGTDWWIPANVTVDFPADASLLEGDDLEALRIRNGIPGWGRELVEGLLPPEARLDETDISYQKGCYIGQEVISRIKSAGKVNKRLARFSIAADWSASAGPLVDSTGAAAGEITSVSPHANGNLRDALGYAKRGAAEFFLKDAAGVAHPVNVI